MMETRTLGDTLRSLLLLVRNLCCTKVRGFKMAADGKEKMKKRKKKTLAAVKTHRTKKNKEQEVLSCLDVSTLTLILV